MSNLYLHMERKGWATVIKAYSSLAYFVFLLRPVRMTLALCNEGEKAMVQNKERIAETVALKWLQAIDEGRYSDSWNETNHFFKNTVKKDQWEQLLHAVREPLGHLISREIKSKAYKSPIPGTPGGQCVIIQFKTSFENKDSAIETVTPVSDIDGSWRVSGYYIN